MKKKSTIYLDESLLRATKVAAARAGKHDYQIVEEALRRYLGFHLLDQMKDQAGLDEGDALRLAYDEIHASRS